MQQPIFNLLTMNNDKMQDKLSSMREEQNIIKNTNDKVFTELNDFLTRYKSSSQYKGQVSENMIGKILSQLYTSAEIINTTGATAQGDFLLKRENKPNIGCIYGSPSILSLQCPIDSLLFVVEMNNSSNQIEGIGLIRNKPDHDKYYKMYSE